MDGIGFRLFFGGRELDGLRFPSMVILQGRVTAICNYGVQAGIAKYSYRGLAADISIMKCEYVRRRVSMELFPSINLALA